MTSERKAAYNKKYYAANKEREAARSRAWRAANPDYHLKRAYDLTQEQFDTLFEGQGRQCAICSADQPGAKHGWHVDHCHQSGAVRGILCHHCNVGIGRFKDNADLIEKAAEYLRKSKI